MDNWIEEEITLAELSERFVGNNDFISPEIYDISSYGIEVLTESENGSITCLIYLILLIDMGFIRPLFMNL